MDLFVCVEILLWIIFTHIHVPELVWVLHSLQGGSHCLVMPDFRAACGVKGWQTIKQRRGVLNSGRHFGSDLDEFTAMGNQLTPLSSLTLLEWAGQ